MIKTNNYSNQVLIIEDKGYSQFFKTSILILRHTILLHLHKCFKNKVKIPIFSSLQCVVDVRIKRIDLPDEVSGSVYDRMRSERERVASEIRAEGRAEAIKKRAEADKIKRVLLSEANRKSREIQGEGEAAAVKIYAEAYSEDPNFFEFYRSLEAYRNSFSKKGDVLVLKPDSEFFKFFKGIDNK